MAVYECVLIWTFNNNEFNTVLHYDSGSQGEPDFLGLTDDIFTKLSTTATAPWVSDMSWTSARWREDIPGGVGQVFFPTGGAVVGTSAASNAVGQVAAIIRKLGTGLVRPSKGRIYMPGIPASAYTDGGQIAANQLNALEAMFTDMMELDDGNGVTLNMVIKASNPSAPNTVPYNLVSDMQAVGNPGTQRRRRLGSGS